MYSTNITNIELSNADQIYCRNLDESNTADMLILETYFSRFAEDIREKSDSTLQHIANKIEHALNWNGDLTKQYISAYNSRPTIVGFTASKLQKPLFKRLKQLRKTQLKEKKQC